MSDKFIADMTEAGFDITVEAGLVLVKIEPIEGVHAGSPLQAGVTVDELRRWPQVLPHWIHLDGSIGFAHTNSRASTKPGWLAHSRQQSSVSFGRPASLEFAAHLRGILGQAIS